MEDRCYVQRLTAQIFVIRECASMDGKPGPNDHLVRAFDSRQDADLYLLTVNGKQKLSNEQHGPEKQPAL